MRKKCTFEKMLQQGRMFLNDAEVSLKQAHSFLLKARLCQSRTAFSQKQKNEDGIPFVFWNRAVRFL